MAYLNATRGFSWRLKLAGPRQAWIASAGEVLAYAVAFVSIIPGILPGITYPYWWLAAFSFYEVGLPPLPPVHGALPVMVGAASAFLILRRGWWYVVPLLTMLLAGYLAATPAGGVLLGAYLLLSYACLGVFAADIRLGSASFFAILGVYALFLLLNDPSLLLVVPRLLEFVLNFFIVRLLVRVAVLNYRQLRRLERVSLGRILVETLRLWSPVAALAAVGIGLNLWLSSYVIGQAYENGVVLVRPDPDGQPASPDIYLDMKHTIDQRFAEVDRSAVDFRQEMQGQADRLPEVLPDAAVREFDQATPAPPLIRGSPCPSGGVKGVLLGGPCRMIVSAVNASYVEYRDAKREQLRAKMLSIANDTRRDANQKLAEAHAEFEASSSAARSHSRSLWLYGFNAFLAVSFVLNVVFFFVLVKSFLLVLARVAYSQEYKAAFSLTPDATEGRPLALGNRPSAKLRLRATRTDSFFLVNNHKWKGTSGKIAFHQPFACYLPRIRNKAYVLNKIEPRKRAGANAAVELEVNAPKKIVAVLLREGQTMVFKFEDFAGMTGRVRVKTVFSPNISLFCLGRRFFYVSATGPGTVLLLGEGEINSGQRSRQRPIAAERILAFDISEKFKLDANRAIADIYLNRAYVIPQGSRTITDSREPPQSGLAGQVWKLVKFLILPW